MLIFCSLFPLIQCQISNILILFYFYSEYPKHINLLYKITYVIMSL